MTELTIAFITYTKGSLMYVTSPQYEFNFLNWLNRDYNSSEFKRETICRVGVQCSPVIVHSIEKKEAVILTLIKDQNNLK